VDQGLGRGVADGDRMGSGGRRGIDGRGQAGVAARVRVTVPVEAVVVGFVVDIVVMVWVVCVILVVVMVLLVVVVRVRRVRAMREPGEGGGSAGGKAGGEVGRPGRPEARSHEAGRVPGAVYRLGGQFRSADSRPCETMFTRFYSRWWGLRKGLRRVRW
jgi:hypothetical protein